MQTENALLNEFLLKLSCLEDVRRGAGQRHKQEFVLIIVLLSTMSGYIGYRAIGDFIKKHKSELIELFKPKKDRVPSFSTVRRVLMNLNPLSFQSVYEDWLVEVRQSQKGCESKTDSEAARWHPIDGKAVRGANKASDSDYTHLVSIFSAFDKIVVGSANVSLKSNEIPCVQTMIENSGLQGVIFTVDALNCQKKTAEISIDTGNDYVMAVKQNQPTLYGQIEEIIATTSPIDADYTLEKNRGREEHRAALVYDAIGIDPLEWKGIRQVVYVNRQVVHKDGKQSVQEAFYIESTGKTAIELNQGIRGHWSVEAMHWVKDVVLKEDASTIHMGNAPEILSIIKNWTMAIFKMNGLKSIIRAIRQVANDLKLCIKLIE